MSTKYIFITGGVVSSLGKGLTSASIGMLLESRGLQVSMMKMDPYLNVDPGTMNPFQHGEVYVTDDGTETDLDLGHYYRYTDSPLSKFSTATSGQIYETVIGRERKGDYLGQTVQVIPHITDEAKGRILACAKQEKKTDVVVIEIGGTVGDIESQPFLEAIRQFRLERPGDCLNIHLTYVPYLRAAGEIKTKPTQHSVQMLRSIGIVPDIVMCRTEQALGKEIRDKISLFCSVPSDAVIEAVDVEHTVYELPIHLHDQGLDNLIAKQLGLSKRGPSLSSWKKLVDTVMHPKGTVTCGIIGKYVKHQDAYKSVFEALEHGAIAEGYKLEIKKFEADVLTHNTKEIDGCDGYLVPGGFGDRGFTGKLRATRYCRENQIPFFGICLGMQALVVEFARNVAGFPGANSTEVEPGTDDPIISLLSEQEKVTNLGGTMRLGAYSCSLKPRSRVARAYGATEISERHRHRYEFNNKYREPLEQAGLTFSGWWDEGDLAEVAEVDDHPWMVGVQYHPEFKSKPTAPHPLFHGFVKAMIAHHKRRG
jgi:CTP synthase